MRLGLIVAVIFSILIGRTCWAFRGNHGKRFTAASPLSRLNGGGGNFERDSKDSPLLVWKGLKAVLPPIVTGAWKGSEGDDNPLGAMYNLVFVRVVTLACTAWYVKGICGEGGGAFSLDFGVGGPVEIPPIGVALVVARILLPPL